MFYKTFMLVFVSGEYFKLRKILKVSIEIETRVLVQIFFCSIISNEK